MQRQSKVLLIIEKNPSGSYGIQMAKRMGLYVIFFTNNRYSNRPSEEDKRYIDELFEVDTNSDDDVMHLVEKISVKTKIDAVITFMEYYVPLVAKVAQYLGVKGNSVECGICTHDKYEMRNKLYQNGASIPQYFMFDSLESLLEGVKVIGYPNVIKPINMAASRAVLKSYNEEELVTNYKQLIQENPPYGVRKETRYLLEEYVDGQEISVEAAVENGKVSIIALTKKYVSGGKHFVEMGHTVPYNVDDKTRMEIERCVVEGIRALGITNSITHSEIKISPKGPKIIEIASRLGGDHIPDLVNYAYGIDMWKMAIEIALGEKISCNKLRNEAASIVFLSANPGKIIRIENKDVIKKKVGIKLLHLDCSVGDRVESLENSLSRIGEIITVGKNCEEAEELSSWALNNIIIETR